jgi:hypothetical protein
MRQWHLQQAIRGTRSAGKPGTRGGSDCSRRGSLGGGGFWAFVAGFAALLVVSPVVTASASSDAMSALSPPARTWAVDCANNEILVIQHPDSYLRYRLHQVDEKGDQVRDQIETPEGSVARLILRGGRPLTPDEDSAERARLADLLNSPSTFARHIHREQDNKKMGINLLKLMPDAMLWSFTPGQPQLPNPAAGEPDLVVLDFKPNPQWSPPNIEAEPLTGLEGRVWIDSRTRHMVRLEGSLFHAVNIGWGMVAHLPRTGSRGRKWCCRGWRAPRRKGPPLPPPSQGLDASGAPAAWSAQAEG